MKHPPFPPFSHHHHPLQPHSSELPSLYPILDHTTIPHCSIHPSTESLCTPLSSLLPSPPSVCRTCAAHAEADLQGDRGRLITTTECECKSSSSYLYLLLWTDTSSFISSASNSCSEGQEQQPIPACPRMPQSSHPLSPTCTPEKGSVILTTLRVSFAEIPSLMRLSVR